MILRIRFLLYFLINVHFTYAVDLDYYFSALRSEKACNNITEKVDCQVKCGLQKGICIGQECYCLLGKILKDQGDKDFNQVETPTGANYSSLPGFVQQMTKQSASLLQSEGFQITFPTVADTIDIQTHDQNGRGNTLSKLLKFSEIASRFSDFHDYNELPEVQYERRSADLSEEAPEYLDESLLYDKAMLRHHIAHFCPNLDIARTCIRTCMKEGKPAFCGKDHVCYCGHRYSNKDVNSAADASSVYAQFKDLYEKYFGPNYQPDLQV